MIQRTAVKKLVPSRKKPNELLELASDIDSEDDGVQIIWFYL